MNGRLDPSNGYLERFFPGLAEQAVESDREIGERVRKLRAEVPWAQLNAAGLVGGIDTEIGRRIAAAVSEPARGHLDGGRALLAAQRFVAKRARNPASSPTRGLLIAGSPGVGKSVAAMYVVASSHVSIPSCPPPSGLLEDYVQRAYATSAFDASLGPMHKFHKDPAAFRRMKTAKILLIDDLGQEQEDIQAGLRECLDARKANRGGITLITTNLGPQELLDRYGAAVRDRMRELFVRVDITGPSLRRSEGGW